jgi:hypothetical protein
LSSKTITTGVSNFRKSLNIQNVENLGDGIKGGFENMKNKLKKFINEDEEEHDNTNFSTAYDYK